MTEATDKPTIEPCYQEGCGERCDSFCRPQSFPKTGMSWTVECLSCGYNTGDMDTEAEAISDHNTVARAVSEREALLPALLSERDGLRDALELIEWGETRDGLDGWCCICGLYKSSGHRNDCKIGIALAKGTNDI